jgi:predicted HD phosphohydrolase
MATGARAAFARMQDATTADYDIINAEREKFLAGHAARVLDAVRLLDGGTEGYAVSRLEHSLQSATRAHRDGRELDYVVMCLVHDIGDTLAPRNHGELAATVLKPYVEPRITWIAKHHPVFQLYYYGPHVGADPDARDRYRDHQWYVDTVEFCERYDENCFDTGYRSMPLDAFVPMVQEVFGREPVRAGPDL